MRPKTAGGRPLAGRRRTGSFFYFPDVAHFVEVFLLANPATKIQRRKARFVPGAGSAGLRKYFLVRDSRRDGDRLSAGTALHTVVLLHLIPDRHREPRQRIIRKKIGCGLYPFLDLICNSNLRRFGGYTLRSRSGRKCLIFSAIQRRDRRQCIKN